jgi:hypothetical protein
MRAAPKFAVMILPVFALLAACNPSPYHPGETAANVPPPPPALPGALGAPLAPGATVPLAGSSMPVVPGTPVRMTASEIAATFSNNTAEGVTADGLNYAAYFAPTGQERFRQGAFADIGSWRVLPDGRLCTALVRLSGNVEQCYLMYRNGNTVTFQRPDGVTVGSVTVVPGDPLNL